jgi:hypothetical protein
MLCKEQVVAWLKELSEHLRGETKENHEILSKIAGLWAKIWTLDLPNTKLER